MYNNGVRAGLCQSASQDDRLSTFDFYAKGKKVEFGVTEDSVYLMLGNSPAERQKQFILMVDVIAINEEIKAIRTGLRNLFFGSKDFVERMSAKYLMH